MGSNPMPSALTWLLAALTCGNTLLAALLRGAHWVSRWLAVSSQIRLSGGHMGASCRPHVGRPRSWQARCRRAWSGVVDWALARSRPWVDWLRTPSTSRLCVPRGDRLLFRSTRVKSVGGFAHGMTMTRQAMGCGRQGRSPVATVLPATRATPRRTSRQGLVQGEVGRRRRARGRRRRCRVMGSLPSGRWHRPFAAGVKWAARPAIPLP